MSEPVRTLWKQPSESLLFDFDFGAPGWIAEGQEIVQVDQLAAARVSGEGTLDVGAPSFSGTRAQARISGGTAASKHLVTCRVTDSAGNKWELEGYLEIVERPEA